MNYSGTPKVVHLTSETTVAIGRTLTAAHAVSLSGGVPSAVMAEEVIQRYGREHTLLWFADVRVEDADLYRFLHDCMQRWKGVLYWYTDGRTPLELAAQKKLIPCNQHCPCSYELKVKPFRQLIKAMPVLPTVNIGLEVHERKRLVSVKKSYAEAIPGVEVVYPLLWREWYHADLFATVRSWDIAIPRLYERGFQHNNCGGACVRQGVGEWRRLQQWDPERYASYEQWEQEQRNQGGPRAERSFASRQQHGVKQPITLAQIRRESQGTLFDDLVESERQA